MIYCVLGICAIALLAYRWFVSAYDYWENRGFPHVEGKMPWGSSPCLADPKRFLGEEVQELYKKLSGHPFGGIYVGRRPELIVRDPQLIKRILIGDFNHFQDRTGEKFRSKHILTQHLFTLEGCKWRPLRAKLSSAFSSGKLKFMYNFMAVCAEQLAHKMVYERNNGGVVDVKDVSARFTTDVIGSCVFGLSTNSLNNDDEPFREIGKNLMKKNPWCRQTEKFYSIFPSVRKWIQLTRLSNDADNVFVDMITRSIEFREKNGIKRNDFLGLLLEMKSQGAVKIGQPPMETRSEHFEDSQDQARADLNLNMIAAQCLVFFVAGFETSSSVQSLALYEIALHSQAQDKLRTEITKTVEKYGDINYQALHDMPYLDQVVNETIRKYPTLHNLTRVCTKPYRIPDTNLTIEEGVKIIIPAFALHHDPQYFPDPNKFDPGRFDKHRLSSITPFTFLPFGEGPRNCIGLRFGLLQTKMGLITILKNHKVVPTAQTVTPLVMRNSLNVITQVDSPIILKLEDLD